MWGGFSIGGSKYQSSEDRSECTTYFPLNAILTFVQLPWFRRTKPRPVQRILRAFSNHDSYTYIVGLGRASANVIRGETDVTVEGFPRSGNTFAVAKLRAANPGIVVAHHLHSAAQVRKSLRLGTPTLILFRDPIDALASWLQREPRLDLVSASRLYSSFYDQALEQQSRIVLSDFPATVGAFEEIVELVNDKFQTHFLVASDKSAMDFISRGSREKGNSVDYLKENSAPRRELEIKALKHEVESKLSAHSHLLDTYEALKAASDSRG